MKIKTGFWRRLFWIVAINFASLSTLLIVAEASQEDIMPLVIVFLLYTFTVPLFYLVFSRHHAKKMYDLVILDPHCNYDAKHNWYIQTVKNICLQAGMKKLPEIAIYSAPDYNAFATGRSKSSSLIAISDKMFHHMDPKSIEAVIAHEVAHIMNGDMVTQTVLDATLRGTVSFLLLPLTLMKGFFLLTHKYEERWIVNLIFWIETILIYILFFLASLVTKAFSRRREFHADLLAAQLTHPRYMMQALNELQEATVPKHQQANMARLFNGTSAFWDVLSTHPSTSRRIKYIQNETQHPTRSKNSFFSWKTIVTMAGTALVVLYFTTDMNLSKVKLPTISWTEATEKIPSVATESHSQGNYIIKQSSQRLLTSSDIMHLAPAELRIARNEIYARHGYPFQSAELQSYFTAKDWYTVNHQFSEQSLSAVEIANIQLIKNREENYTFSVAPSIDTSDITFFMEQYVGNMVEAINNRDYTTVANFIQPGSPLEQAQHKLITNLHVKDITERVNYIDVRNISQVSSTSYDITLFESIYVIRPDRTHLTEYLWTYRLVNGAQGWQLASIRSAQ